MSRKLFLFNLLVMLAGLLALQGIFWSRVHDPESVALINQIMNQHLDARDALSWRAGSWKTGWFLSAQADSLELSRASVTNPLLVLKNTRLDIDLVPAIFKAQIAIQWESRERQRGSMLRGVTELGLFDLMPRSSQFQFEGVSIETLLLLASKPIRSSPLLSGLQGLVNGKSRGTMEKGRVSLEISQLRWRIRELPLPLLELGDARTEISYGAGQVTFHPPLSFTDARTGLKVSLDYEQAPRLTLSGPSMLVAALAYSQGCRTGATLELLWSPQGFTCR